MSTPEVVTDGIRETRREGSLSEGWMFPDGNVDRAITSPRRWSLRCSTGRTTTGGPTRGDSDATSGSTGRPA